MVFSLAACGPKTTATTMRLMRTEGQVHVSDDDGAEVAVRESLGLYGGYRVDTGRESFAWIDLDNVRLTKMDEPLWEEAPAATGIDGDTSWRLSGDGVLTIGGTGATKDYTADKPASWIARGLPDIRAVVIENGITRVGNRSLISCHELTEANIPDSVASIGEKAFSYTGLTSIVIPGGTATIERQAFEGCKALTAVHLSPRPD